MTIHTSYHGLLLPVIRVIASLSIPVALLAAPGLTITPPGSAAPGQTLAVTVTPSGSFTQVVVVGEGPIGYSSVLAVTNKTVSPYQLSLPIPANISPGVYSLTARGVSPAGNATSAPVTISVERPDAPIQIDVTPPTLYLPVGQRAPLRVIGTYADGTQLDITHSASTAFTSSSSTVASVDSQGYVTALGPSPVVYGILEMARITVNSSLTIPVFTPPALSVTPEWPVLYASQKEQFSAIQPGMAALPIKWTITPQVGSIDNSGLYTAPNTIAAGGQSITVTAALRDNPALSVSTGLALFPPVQITISPGPALTLTSGQSQRFSQDVSNALDNRVDWSISPKLGTIDNTGLYTAPATVTKQQSVVVTATSIADQTKSASATVTLTH